MNVSRNFNHGKTMQKKMYSRISGQFSNNSTCTVTLFNNLFHSLSIVLEYQVLVQRVVTQQDGLLVTTMDSPNQHSTTHITT